MCCNHERQVETLERALDEATAALRVYRDLWANAASGPVELTEFKIKTLFAVADHAQRAGEHADIDPFEWTVPIQVDYLRTIARQLEQGLADRAVLVELQLQHDIQRRRLEHLEHAAAEWQECAERMTGQGSGAHVVRKALVETTRRHVDSYQGGGL